MNEQVVEERRGWASDIVWVVLYSILVLLVMLLLIDVPTPGCVYRKPHPY